MTDALAGLDVPSFLARALLLEEESGERMEELADVMEVHHDGDAEALLRKLADFSRKHAEEVRTLTRGIELPQLDSWAVDWPEAESPETVPFDDLDYLMTETQVLQVALESEARGQHYYASVATAANDPEVKALAAQFAEEESEHVALIRKWLKSFADQSDMQREDLDPPNQPE